jgi:hypothetical protein|tara:strand:+ start:208 stop:462 length:255 start_codon:yes stop_codon:yes gene_type:complete
MAILTEIDGIPLYTTVSEALAYAAANGLSGYHTHNYQGQVGFMGGATHGQAATPSSGFNANNQTNTPPASSSSGFSGGGGGGGY